MPEKYKRNPYKKRRRKTFDKFFDELKKDIKGKSYVEEMILYHVYGEEMSQPLVEMYQRFLDVRAYKQKMYPADEIAKIIAKGKKEDGKAIYPPINARQANVVVLEASQTNIFGNPQEIDKEVERHFMIEFYKKMIMDVEQDMENAKIDRKDGYVIKDKAAAKIIELQELNKESSRVDPDAFNPNTFSLIPTSDVSVIQNQLEQDNQDTDTYAEEYDGN